jgi:hypothetical protein
MFMPIDQAGTKYETFGPKDIPKLFDDYGKLNIGGHKYRLSEYKYQDITSSEKDVPSRNAEFPYVTEQVIFANLKRYLQDSTSRARMDSTSRALTDSTTRALNDLTTRALKDSTTKNLVEEKTRALKDSTTKNLVEEKTQWPKNDSPSKNKKRSREVTASNESSPAGFSKYTPIDFNHPKMRARMGDQGLPKQEYAIQLNRCKLFVKHGDMWERLRLSEDGGALLVEPPELRAMIRSVLIDAKRRCGKMQIGRPDDYEKPAFLPGQQPFVDNEVWWRFIGPDAYQLHFDSGDYEAFWEPQLRVPSHIRKKMNGKVWNKAGKMFYTDDVYTLEDTDQGWKVVREENTNRSNAKTKPFVLCMQDFVYVDGSLYGRNSEKKWFRNQSSDPTSDDAWQLQITIPPELQTLVLPEPTLCNSMLAKPNAFVTMHNDDVYVILATDWNKVIQTKMLQTLRMNQLSAASSAQIHKTMFAEKEAAAKLKIHPEPQTLALSDPTLRNSKLAKPNAFVTIHKNNVYVVMATQLNKIVQTKMVETLRMNQLSAAANAQVHDMLYPNTKAAAKVQNEMKLSTYKNQEEDHSSFIKHMVAKIDEDDFLDVFENTVAVEYGAHGNLHNDPDELEVIAKSMSRKSGSKPVETQRMILSMRVKRAKEYVDNIRETLLQKMLEQVEKDLIEATPDAESKRECGCENVRVHFYANMDMLHGFYFNNRIPFMHMLSHIPFVFDKGAGIKDRDISSCVSGILEMIPHDSKQITAYLKSIKNVEQTPDATSVLSTPSTRVNTLTARRRPKPAA